jgi:thiol-disulfide isomerase/thioredoxin
MFYLLSGCLESTDDTSRMNFVFSTLNGKEKQLSDYYGKFILLDLMGVNCQPCFYQMFELEKISKNYSSNVLTIISIDVWIFHGENVDLINEYIDYINNEFDLSLSWIFGLDDSEGTIFSQYAQNGVPTIYILDENGNIYYSHVGYTDYSTLSAKIDELLEKKI